MQRRPSRQSSTTSPSGRSEESGADRGERRWHAARTDQDRRGQSRPYPLQPQRNPTWERLENQLGWYDRKSRYNQRRYQWLKLLELAVAAALPVVAGVGSPVWVTGGLAAVIVVLEGAQHLYQFQEQWITSLRLPGRLYGLERRPSCHAAWWLMVAGGR
jgi:hypothetical protein